MNNTLSLIRNVLLAACLLMGLALPHTRTAQAESRLSAMDLERNVDATMQEQLNRLHIPGAAVAVTKGSSILFSKGYGFADLEDQTPMDPARTIIPIGSLTKSITATAAMQLVERNQLELRRNVNDYLTAFKISPHGQEPITLHHLLTHTAGLDQAVYSVNGSSKEQTVSTGEYLQTYYHKQPPVREPGVKYEYSNVGLGTVGYVIEQSSGQTLNEYLTQHVFQPLSMPSASLGLPDHNPNLAKSYSYDKSGFTPVPYSYINLEGAGAISVIPQEFAHYLILHANQGEFNGVQVLAKDTAAEMHKQQFAAHPRLDGLGYGFFRGELKEGVPMLWHTGEIDSFISKMVIVPSEKLGIFVVANASNSGLQLHDLLIESISAFLPVPPAKPQLQPQPLTLGSGGGQSASFIQTSKLELSKSGQDYGPIKELEGDYQAGINPRHGWGKWLRMLGGFSYRVTAVDSRTLEVKGYFPGRDEKQSLSFTHLEDGLFQAKKGEETLFFSKLDGNWSLTNSENVTIPKVTFWQQTYTLLGLYIASAAFFVVLLVVWLFQSVVRLFKKDSGRLRPGFAVIALLNTIFFYMQFTYGNSQVTYGYPLWYAWGISALPLVSAVIAVFLLIKRDLRKASGGWPDWGRAGMSVMTLAVTGYLFYWNFLPVHYS
ncbi:serine hydrolase domain-containing protein [Paenibacillus puerhi]|uniref:serine hydrolase domain-containing protein n=1 Tax=Paenibacillus puerhi TaxID=2692622 RepID=UPI00135A8826|nr:serine hydrolase domain-containing protein [Paenibacillus puerhi]